MNTAKKGVKMDKEIKGIQMLDKEQLENILIKIVNMKNAKRIASNNAKRLINKEYRKSISTGD